MKNPNRALFWSRCLASLCLWVAFDALAAPRLPGFFSDNMVLQRDMPVPVWGWADPAEAVTVAFGGQTVEATADDAGTWLVRLAPMPASAEARELSVRSTAAETDGMLLEGVVVGDVWLCSGQSNMEWALGRVKNAGAEIAAADYPLIRHAKIQHATADIPAADVASQWLVCSPESARGFTAVGYIFARKLHRELGVPIGLIGSNWGGTKIEPWTPPEGFRAVPELADITRRIDATLLSTAEGKAAYAKVLTEVRAWLTKAEAAIEQGTPVAPLPALPSVGTSQQDPTRIYNAMIHPLIPYAIRGAIWYQGESNGSEGISYYHKKRALIEGWRTLWNQGDFPFYFVQLANFGQPNDTPAGGDGYSGVREAQRRCLTIPRTGMAVIIDIGEAGNIHPTNKQDVGLRLALWALANEYGRHDLVFSGPLYREHTIEADKIRIAFEQVGTGLMVGKKEGLAPAAEVPDGALARFAIAGADRQWSWADAIIEGDTVVVSSPAVPNPVAVRYAFSHNPAGCNLYNREGLPASPFRTDDW